MIRASSASIALRSRSSLAARPRESASTEGSFSLQRAHHTHMPRLVRIEMKQSSGLRAPCQTHPRRTLVTAPSVQPDAGSVWQLPGQVGREDSSHDISRYAQEAIGGTPQSRAFIFVASLLGGLLQ